MNIYYLITGVMLGFYAGFMYKLINRSYVKKSYQS
jgi:hypothetical protein